MASFSRRLCGRETAYKLVKKKGKAKDKYYGKMILDLGNEVRSSMEERTGAMENLVRKLVERDLYWTRVRAHEFYREMIRRGFVFEERLDEAIDVLVEDEESPSSEPRGSFLRRMIKESVDAGIAAERARQVNVGFMKCNPTVFCGTEGSVNLRRWFEKTESVFGISECAEGKNVKFAAATLQGPALTW
ncbi:hypothetical protein Tco_1581316 [Tanacetum coccineum]